MHFLVEGFPAGLAAAHHKNNMLVDAVVHVPLQPVLEPSDAAFIEVPYLMAVPAHHKMIMSVTRAVKARGIKKIHAADRAALLEVFQGAVHRGQIDPHRNQAPQGACVQRFLRLHDGRDHLPPEARELLFHGSAPLPESGAWKINANHLRKSNVMKASRIVNPKTGFLSPEAEAAPARQPPGKTRLRLSGTRVGVKKCCGDIPYGQMFPLKWNYDQRA